MSNLKKLLIIMCLVATGTMSALAEPTFKVLFDSEQAISVFVYDEVNYVAGDTFTTDGTTITVSSTYNLALHANANSTKVIFDESFANYYPTTTKNMFSFCRQLTTIEHMEYLNTSQVTDMSNMFYVCEALPTVDLSHFDTHNVTDMSSMFSCCSLLQEINLHDLDFSSVVNLEGMLNQCLAITEIDLSGISMPNAENMSRTFSNCRAVTSIDFTGFSAPNVTNMSYLLANDVSLTSST